MSKSVYKSRTYPSSSGVSSRVHRVDPPVALLDLLSVSSFAEAGSGTEAYCRAAFTPITSSKVWDGHPSGSTYCCWYCTSQVVACRQSILLFALDAGTHIGSTLMYASIVCMHARMHPGSVVLPQQLCTAVATADDDHPLNTEWGGRILHTSHARAMQHSVPVCLSTAVLLPVVGRQLFQRWVQCSMWG